MRLRTELLVTLVVLMPCAALAQEPKRVQTVKVHEAPPGSDELYRVANDGTVSIDWTAVETLASTKANKVVLPVAQMMLAIRDGTWKALKR